MRKCAWKNSGLGATQRRGCGSGSVREEGIKGIDAGSQIAEISGFLASAILIALREYVRHREINVRRMSHKFPRLFAEQSNSLKSRAASLRSRFMDIVDVHRQIKLLTERSKNVKNGILK